MLFFDGALGLFALGVWIFCILDVITTPEGDVRNLPKLLWLLIVILLLDIGSIAWLFAGRPWAARARTGVAARGSGGTGGSLGPTPVRKRPQASNPDDDEEFLAGLQARADEQRRRAREEQQKDEPPTTD